MQDSTQVRTYTREQLLSKYRRFECPRGLEAHTLIYSATPLPEPQLFIQPANLSSAVSLKKPPRTAVATAVGAALHGARARQVPPKPPNPVPVGPGEMKKAIVRWSDGRPLFLVASRDLLPLADEFLIKRGIMRGRRYKELYEAAVADLYNDLVRQKRIILPAPLSAIFQLTPETSVALWPTFRELFIQTEDNLHDLSLWEDALEDGLHPQPAMVMVLPADVLWEYLDPQNQVQGPFTSSMMSEWFRGDFFPAALPVRVCGSSRFFPLSELYPPTQRDVFVPFVTTPPLDVMVPPPFMPERELETTPIPVKATDAAPVQAPVQPPPSPVSQEAAAPPANTVPAQTERRKQSSISRMRSDAEHVARLSREQAEQQEEQKRLEAMRIRIESERVAAAILREKQLEQEQQARIEAARREREAKEARALAEQRALESNIMQLSVPALSSTSGGGGSALTKWKQPTLIDRQDAGPSLEESRRIKESVGGGSLSAPKASTPGTDWSRKLAAKAPATKVKKVAELPSARPNVWQLRPTSSQPEALWSNDPPLESSVAATEESAPQPVAPRPPVEVQTPPMRVETSPAVVSKPVAKPQIVATNNPRADIQQLCAHYDISLDPDFVTMLIAQPDLEAAKSFLEDNLPNFSQNLVSDFAEAFWDLVKHPFQPVAPRKSGSRRK